MKPIFLIGYMGSGKTTLGRALAKQMDINFIDLDIHIEARYRMTVSQIFAEKGEDEFRKIERNMLQEVAHFQDIIIACGGGTPCHFDNIDFMNSHGTTIYLHVPADILLYRLTIPAAKSRRPLVAQKTDDQLREFINSALAEREPFYLKASLIFDATLLATDKETTQTAIHLAETLSLG